MGKKKTSSVAELFFLWYSQSWKNKEETLLGLKQRIGKSKDMTQNVSRFFSHEEMPQGF